MFLSLPELAEGGDATAVGLDGDDRARVGGQKGAGQAAGAGPDFERVAAGERFGRGGDAREDRRIDKEVLAEALVGVEIVAADRRRERG